MAGGLLGCKPDPSEGILGLDHAVLAVGFGKETGRHCSSTIEIETFEEQNIKIVKICWVATFLKG